jgi:hypothetical protein
MFTTSLRTFGGRFHTSTVWVFTPDNEDSWSEMERSSLTGSGVVLHRFSVPEEVQGFPFGNKVYAAAAAEAEAAGRSRTLVWMDSDSLILSEPEGLLLRPDERVGCRPVDHTLISSSWEAPIDPFWAQLYQDLGVPVERLYPILTSVDEQLIRPYFNAGFLVVRPELEMLGKWAVEFQRLLQQSDYLNYFEDHILYRIFFHQAVLAGVLLASFEEREIHSLIPFVNYPLHMHAAYPEAKRPQSLEELMTARYDLLFEKVGWEAEIPLTTSWKSWLQAQPRVKWGEANRLDPD